MKFRLSSEFGVFEEVREGKAHSGIDLAMPEGTTLRSVADGVVERITDYGNTNIGTGVIVRTDDGTRLIYGHMDRVSVEVGDKLSVGETLGLSGNTGHSTGPHLHFGAFKDGEYVDPSGYSETLDALSGDLADSAILKSGLFGGFDPGEMGGPITQLIGNKAKDATKERMTEEIIEFLEVTLEVAAELLYSITLLGGGLLIILWVAGMRRAGRYFGILYVVNIIVMYLFGEGEA